MNVLPYLRIQSAHRVLNPVLTEYGGAHGDHDWESVSVETVADRTEADD